MLWSPDVVAREELNLRPLPCQGKTNSQGSGWHRAFPQVNGRLGVSGTDRRARECPVEHAPGAPSGILQEHKSPPGRVLGGPVGAGYWGSSSRTLAAWAPFGPGSTSNSTACPSLSER
jgi:hypothetical protein